MDSFCSSVSLDQDRALCMNMIGCLAHRYPIISTGTTRGTRMKGNVWDNVDNRLTLCQHFQHIHNLSNTGHPWGECSHVRFVSPRLDSRYWCPHQGKLECHLTLQTEDDKILVPSTRYQEVNVIPHSEENIHSPRIELVTRPEEDKEASVTEYIRNWIINCLPVFRVQKSGTASPPPILVVYWDCWGRRGLVGGGRGQGGDHGAWIGQGDRRSLDSQGEILHRRHGEDGLCGKW